MGDSRPLSGRAGLAGGRNSPAGSLASVEVFAAHALQNVNTPLSHPGGVEKTLMCRPVPSCTTKLASAIAQGSTRKQDPGTLQAHSREIECGSSVRRSVSTLA